MPTRPSRAPQGPLDRPLRIVRPRPAAMLVLIVALAPALACQGDAHRAIRGARLYADGTEALARGEADRAIEDLSRAAALVPHASEIQNHLGLAYWRSGREASARAAFERAIALDCDNVAARRNLANLVRGGARRAVAARSADRRVRTRVGRGGAER